MPGFLANNPHGYLRCATLVAAIGLASPALAAADLNCDAYAGAAVAQHHQNIAQSCGLTGPRWSDNFAAHRAWCQAPATQMQHLTTEDSARTASLAACANRLEARFAACHTYADKAVIAANASAQRGCGFGGGRWSAAYGGHFDWCMKAPEAAVRQEDTARAGQLQGCFDAQAAAAARNRADACAHYANIAINQQRENQGRSCGFGGGRWQGDFVAHHGWCMQVGPDAAQGETAARDADLRRNCLVSVCRDKTTASTKPPFFKRTKVCRNEPKPWR